MQKLIFPARKRYRQDIEDLKIAMEPPEPRLSRDAKNLPRRPSGHRQRSSSHSSGLRNLTCQVAARQTSAFGLMHSRHCISENTVDVDWGESENVGFWGRHVAQTGPATYSGFASISGMKRKTPFHDSAISAVLTGVRVVDMDKETAGA